MPQRTAPQAEKIQKKFGRWLRWIPKDLPDHARRYWPKTSGWPTSDDVKRFVDATYEKPDARLAILSGLRHHSEPGNTQTLVALGSTYVSIAALAMTLFAFGPFWVGMPYIAGIFVLLAIIGFGAASQIDERRKVAFIWLQAFEDRLSQTDWTKPSERR